MLPAVGDDERDYAADATRDKQRKADEVKLCRCFQLGSAEFWPTKAEPEQSSRGDCHSQA